MISLETLKQRKIVQWALAYLAAAWLLLQLVGLLADAYSWPAIVLRLLPVILVLGLLITLVIAWYHGEKGAQRVSVPELVMIAGILTLAGAAVAFVRKDKKPAVNDVATIAAATAEQGSIAVLPFADMSPEKNQAFFSDGLTEELLNVLAQIPELRVAARTSSFSFRDTKASVDSIARALRVEYVLEGSVRTAANRVRITAQLIKAATGFHVWSNTYDRDVKDVFAVQDEISRAIVDALRLKIGGMDTLVLAGTSDPEAHTLVLRGLFEVNKKTEPGVQEGKRLLEQAVARDPAYAKAWAGLGSAHWYIAYRRFGPADANYAQAKKDAEKALALDARTGEAYVVLGRVMDIHEWRFAEAEAQFGRAVALNPGLAEAHMLRAWLLMRLGRQREAIASAQRSVLLDPISPASHNTLGAMYSYARQTDNSINAYREALAVSPDNPIVLANMALTYATANRHAEALALAKASEKVQQDDQFTQATLGFVHARAGRRTEAEAELRKLREDTEASAYLIAMIFAGMGETDAAFEELERAVAQHDDYVADLSVDDVFDPIRSDPRMAALLKRIGLPTPAS
jgi:adenylate cyclase